MINATTVELCQSSYGGVMLENCKVEFTSYINKCDGIQGEYLNSDFMCYYICYELQNTGKNVDVFAWDGKRAVSWTD